MNRQVYLEKFKNQLDEWNSDIDRMELKAREAKADAKLRYERQLATVRAQFDEAKRTFAEVQTANESAWKDLEQGATDAWDHVKKSIVQAKQEFN